MSTSSPTTFDASYWGVFGFLILGLVILTLLCCACIAKAQNDAKAFKIRAANCQKRAEELQRDDKEKQQKFTSDDWAKCAEEMEKLQHEHGVIPSCADALVTPFTNNDVSKDASLFFYHTGMGRFLLLSIEGTLNLIIGVLSLVFTGLSITYINTYVLAGSQNPGQLSLNIILFVGSFVVVLVIARDQYRIFFHGRIGETGVVEPLTMNGVLIR